MRATVFPGGVSVQYSPINQAWFVMWYASVLCVYNIKADALDYARSITKEG